MAALSPPHEPLPLLPGRSAAFTFTRPKDAISRTRFTPPTPARIFARKKASTGCQHDAPGACFARRAAPMPPPFHFSRRANIDVPTMILASQFLYHCGISPLMISMLSSRERSASRCGLTRNTSRTHVIAAMPADCRYAIIFPTALTRVEIDAAGITDR